MPVLGQHHGFGGQPPSDSFQSCGPRLNPMPIFSGRKAARASAPANRGRWRNTLRPPTHQRSALQSDVRCPWSGSVGLPSISAGRQHVHRPRMATTTRSPAVMYAPCTAPRVGRLHEFCRAPRPLQVHEGGQTWHRRAEGGRRLSFRNPRRRACVSPRRTEPRNGISRPLEAQEHCAANRRSTAGPSKLRSMGPIRGIRARPRRRGARTGPVCPC